VNRAPDLERFFIEHREDKTRIWKEAELNEALDQGRRRRWEFTQNGCFSFRWGDSPKLINVAVWQLPYQLGSDILL
jgi:hypothetical protein